MVRQGKGSNREKRKKRRAEDGKKQYVIDVPGRCLVSIGKDRRLDRVALKAFPKGQG